MKWEYSIVYNNYQQKYIVFKENEERFVAVGVFKSECRKDCVEYIKKIKGKVKKNNGIKNNKTKN